MQVSPSWGGLPDFSWTAQKEEQRGSVTEDNIMCARGQAEMLYCH